VVRMDQLAQVGREDPVHRVDLVVLGDLAALLNLVDLEVPVGQLVVGVVVEGVEEVVGEHNRQVGKLEHM